MDRWDRGQRPARGPGTAREEGTLTAKAQAGPKEDEAAGGATAPTQHNMGDVKGHRHGHVHSHRQVSRPLSPGRPPEAGGPAPGAAKLPAAACLWNTPLTHTFLPRAHGTFTNIGRVLGHKTRLNKLRRIQVTQIMFLDQKELNYKSITERALENAQISGI